jgi:hypothetical protein
MFVSACYFECEGYRRDADRMQSRLGSWVACFTDVPACHATGMLTVESSVLLEVGATSPATLSLRDCRDDLSVDPRAETGPGNRAPSEVRSLQAHLSTPAAGTHERAENFAATGTVDGGTVLSKVYFLCTATQAKTYATIPTPMSSSVKTKRTSGSWAVEFSNVPSCPGGGTVTALGDDGSSDSHGNITVP